jgi:uncharacterized protein (TIGR00730 family)
MNKVRSICVFCGASNKIPKDYIAEGVKLGQMIAKKGYNTVFGAGDCGIMAAVANGALEEGGHVLGVFPRVLDGLEAEHKHLSETIIVDDMHTRKMTMFERSDAFIIMPGGFGTMDETFEVITWKQLHTHNKPIILYDYKGYWENWMRLTNQFIDMGFASERTRSMYEIVDKMEDIFKFLK